MMPIRIVLVVIALFIALSSAAVAQCTIRPTLVPRGYTKAEMFLMRHDSRTAQAIFAEAERIMCADYSNDLPSALRHQADARKAAGEGDLPGARDALMRAFGISPYSATLAELVSVRDRIAQGGNADGSDAYVTNVYKYILVLNEEPESFARWDVTEKFGSMDASAEALDFYHEVAATYKRQANLSALAAAHDARRIRPPRGAPAPSGRSPTRTQ